MDAFEIGVFGYSDPVSLNSGNSKLIISENSGNQVPVKILGSGESIDASKINIQPTKQGWFITMDKNGFIPPENSVLKLIIKYTNNLTVETVYEQNIFFLKKEI